MTRYSSADYIDRLKHLAENEDHIQRFFLYQGDLLSDMEAVPSSEDIQGEFYDSLIELCRAWILDMGHENWKEVVAYNDALNGSNKNWLIDAELAAEEQT